MSKNLNTKSEIKSKVCFFGFSLLLTGLFLLFFSNLYLFFGSSPIEKIYLDYFFGFLFSFFILFFLILARSRKIVVLAWLWRILVVFLFFVFYYQFYANNSDYYRFHKDAVGLISEPLLSKISLEIGRGTDNVIKIISLIYSFFGQNFFLSQIIFAFIGFLGVYFFWKGWRFYLGRSKRIFFSDIFFLFLPSVSFWGSDLGKDSLVLLPLGLYFYNSCIFLKRKKIKYLFFAVILVLLAMFIRFWLCLFLIPLWTVLTISVFSSKRKVFFFFLSLLFFFVVIFSLFYLFRYFKINSLNQLVEFVNFQSHKWMHGGSRQEIPLFYSLRDIVNFLPKGIFSALFEPTFFNFKIAFLNCFSLLASFENTFIFLLLTSSFLLFFQNKHLLRDKLFWFLIVSILSWSFVYAFISPQNLGTACRWRTQISLFLIALGFYIWEKRKYTKLVKSQTKI